MAEGNRKPWFLFYSYVPTSSACRKRRLYLILHIARSRKVSLTCYSSSWVKSRWIVYTPRRLLEVRRIRVAVQGQLCVCRVTTGKIGGETPHSAVHRLSGNTRELLVRVQMYVGNLWFEFEKALVTLSLGSMGVMVWQWAVNRMTTEDISTVCNMNHDNI